MRIRFLGTGSSQGTPVIACKCEVCRSNDPIDKRLRSSVLVETGGKTILIDAGPDFREQMLLANAQKLDAILITHAHKDHIGGLDDVRAFNYVLKKPIDIYARSDAEIGIKDQFSYAFQEEKYPGVPEIKIHHIQNQPFFIDNLKVIPIEVLHYKLPIFGYRIEDFAYITDASEIHKTEAEKLKQLKVLVINAIRKKEHYAHFSLRQAVEIVEKLAPQHAYITHISHQMGKSADINQELPDNLMLAYDNLELNI